ncbi:MAG: Zn-dependent alcohol dehydrogenase [Dehalococcoidia bacterium]
MKAAVFHGPHQPLTIESVEIDAPRGREVLVRTVASGVCHSDLHYLKGDSLTPAPAVLGHEAAGIVEAIGADVTEFAPGDHVIGCLSQYCGHCGYCLTGRTYLCRERPMRAAGEPPKLTWNGAPINQFHNLSTFAERMLVHEHAIVKIRTDMPLDRAALIGCGVTTGVGAALRTAKVEPGATVAVYGAGGVGLAAIQGARIAGARTIIAVDIHEHKLAVAREVGATHVVDANAGDPARAVRAITGDGVDYSFEAIGLKQTQEQAFASIRPGGVCTLIGLSPVGTKLEIDARAIMTDRTLRGSVMGSNRFKVDMPQYVDFYLQGRLRLDEMITRRARLDDINDAFRALEDGEGVRTVLVFD